jgi:7-cyano-7-deazaguanine synthase in queuosine biosynthesis
MNDTSYYEGINQGDHYLCDRCEVAKLRADEFELNVRDIVRLRRKNEIL